MSSLLNKENEGKKIYVEIQFNDCFPAIHKNGTIESIVPELHEINIRTIKGLESISTDMVVNALIS